MEAGSLARDLAALTVAAGVFGVIWAALSGRANAFAGRSGRRLQRLFSRPWEVTSRAGGCVGPARRPRRRALDLRSVLRSSAVWVAAAAVMGWASGGMIAAAGAGLVVLALTESRRQGRVVATRRKLKEGLENALETIVASLRAGQGLARAIEEASRGVPPPLSDVLTEALNRYRAGTSLMEALARMTDEWSLPEVSYFVACLEAHFRSGGDVTVLLVNLAGLIRERRHLTVELASRSTEARSTAWILASLPPGLLLYILLAEPSQLDPLVSTPAGTTAAAVAAGCWVTGVVLIRSLVGSVAREIEEEG